jgi:hypothetical protein
MTAANRTSGFRFWLWLIRLIGVIVPRRLRQIGVRNGKPSYNTATLLENWDRLDWRNKVDLFWRSTSAFWDAIWMQTYRWEDAMIQDLRFGVRMLLKHKASPPLRFSRLRSGSGQHGDLPLIDALRLRTLPVRAPRIGRSAPRGYERGAGGLWRPTTVTYPIWEKIRERQQALSGIFAWGTATPTSLLGRGALRSRLY